MIKFFSTIARGGKFIYSRFRMSKFEKLQTQIKLNELRTPIVTTMKNIVNEAHIAGEVSETMTIRFHDEVITQIAKFSPKHRLIIKGIHQNLVKNSSRKRTLDANLNHVGRSDSIEKDLKRIEDEREEAMNEISIAKDKFDDQFRDQISIDT